MKIRWIVLLSLVSAVCLPARGQDRPNIIFMFSDDHTWQAVGAYRGFVSSVNPTPNLDRLASQGVLFRNAFVTNSICAPSRAVVLTGKYSHINGHRDNLSTFDGSQQTFPKLLQKAGYQTAIIGKWHLKSEPTGFDHWSVLIGQGPYYDPPMRTPGGIVKHKGYTTEVIADQVHEWLENERDPERPFLLMYQHKAAHSSFTPGPRQFERYTDGEIPEPPTLFDNHDGLGTAAQMATCDIEFHLQPDVLALTGPPPELDNASAAVWNRTFGAENREYREGELGREARIRWRYQRYIKNYLRTVAGIDDSVGRLMKYLDESGLAENTVVIYTSDQGFYLGEHGWYDKRFMYEESLRIPLIVRWPTGIEAGRVENRMALNLDFAPTLLELAGADIPADMQGASLVPLLKGAPAPGWRDAIYYHYYEFPSWCYIIPHDGVRTARHKLIHYYTYREWELFDLVNDPDEMRSVYGDPAYAEVVGDLERRLSSMRSYFGVD